MNTVMVGTSDDSLGQYIKTHMLMYGGSDVLPPFTAIGWARDGKLAGEAVFNNYTGSNIDIHLRAKFTRQKISDVYKYVFVQLKCNRLTAMIPVTNEKMSHLTRRLGFEYECTLRDYQGTPDEPIDVEVYRLSKFVAMKWIN